MFSTVAIGGAMQHHLRVMLLQPRQGMAKQLTGNALLLQRRMHGNVGHGPSMGVVLPIELLDFRQRQNWAQWMAVIRIVNGVAENGKTHHGRVVQGVVRHIVFEAGCLDDGAAFALPVSLDGVGPLVAIEIVDVLKHDGFYSILFGREARSVGFEPAARYAEAWLTILLAPLVNPLWRCTGFPHGMGFRWKWMSAVRARCCGSIIAKVPSCRLGACWTYSTVFMGMRKMHDFP